MKARIFYDSNGEIRSVVALACDAQTTPTSSDYAWVEAELTELGAETLADIHSNFRVSADGRVSRATLDRSSYD